MKTTDTKGAYPMAAIDVVEFIDSAVREFRKSYINTANTSLEVNTDVLDAIIVDFVNNLAISQGVDYALYTIDLQSPDKNSENNWYLNFSFIKFFLRKWAEKYKKSGVYKSVMRNAHMNNVRKKFSDETANKIVDDIVNYILEQL